METGGARRTLRYAYVVGCDGAHSTVRRQLGIQYEGVDAIQQFVSTFVRSPELGELAARDRAWTYWTYGRRIASLIAIDGDELWLNHVAFAPDHDTEGEDPGTAAAGVGGPGRSSTRCSAWCAGPAGGSSPGGTAPAACSWPATPPTSGSRSAGSA